MTYLSIMIALLFQPQSFNQQQKNTIQLFWWCQLGLGISFTFSSRHFFILFQKISKLNSTEEIKESFFLCPRATFPTYLASFFPNWFKTPVHVFTLLIIYIVWWLWPLTKNLEMKSSMSCTHRLLITYINLNNINMQKPFYKNNKKYKERWGHLDEYLWMEKKCQAYSHSIKFWKTKKK